MTFLYILAVSTAASIDIAAIEPIFRDVVFILIMISGVGMAITLDNNRPDISQKITIAYILFSIFATVFFSTLIIASYIELNFPRFVFYILIGLAAAFSPKVARKVLPEAPDELKKGLLNLLRAFFSGMAKKLDHSPITNEEEIKEKENDTI